MELDQLRGLTDNGQYLKKARSLLDVQVGFGSCYNRNSIQLIPADVQQESGVPVAHSFIEEINSENLLNIEPIVKLSTPGNCSFLWEANRNGQPIRSIHSCL